jgi:hypothetical protein
VNAAASPPATRPPPSPSSWGYAATRGITALLAIAVLGQAVPFVANLFGAGLAWITSIKLGWFYVMAFHRVGLRIEGNGTGAHALVLTVSIALLTGTLAAGWILFRAGRASALRAGGDRRRRLVAVGCVAFAYAIPSFLVSAFTTVRFALGATPFGSAVRIAPVAWEAFALPFALAIACGAAGALSVEPAGTRIRTILVGGWRMFASSLILALVGVLVLAALRPAGLSAYAHAVAAGGIRRAALLLAHHALLLPNQSIDVLAPSMLGCTGFRGAGTWLPLLCAGRLPAFGPLGWRAAVAVVLSEVSSAGAGRVPTGPMAAGYALFLFVPIASCLYGGWWVRSRIDSKSSRTVGTAGAVAVFAAAAVFAGLVYVGSWAAGISEVSAIGRTRSAVTLGPRPVPTALLALAWGVVGGAAGALLWRPQEAEPPEPPPSPTSV